MIKILVLCTGNSCRSIMTEGLLNHYGKDFFNAYSAGSHPAGYVHPLSIKTLEKNKIFLDNFKSQSWDDFSDINFDLVITVCDNAAGETCPVYLKNTLKAHWGVADPAKFRGTEEEVEIEFLKVFNVLKKRCLALVQNYKQNNLLNIDQIKDIGNLI